MAWNGKVPKDHSNMRTEFSWMNALNADHFNINQYESVNGYDAVFIIFPKGTTNLNRVGVEMIMPEMIRLPAFDGDNIAKTRGMSSIPGEIGNLINSLKPKDTIAIYEKPIVETLKKNNTKVCNVQEGPCDFFNDYDLPTQFNFYNQLAECDILFAHNEYDTHFYKGLFPQTQVSVIPSLMFPTSITPVPEEKAIIGGNFARWYGGFQSYVVATHFECPIFVPASHCKRQGEEQVPGLKHLPWVMWNDWMAQLSTFKYAVNLMPTVAAGTFSMNCASFGIPCIGNDKVDTQIALFPELCVDINDIHQARFLAMQLKNDKDFYNHCSYYAKSELKKSRHADTTRWLEYMTLALSGTLVTYE